MKIIPGIILCGLLAGNAAGQRGGMGGGGLGAVLADFVAAPADLLWQGMRLFRRSPNC